MKTGTCLPVARCTRTPRTGAQAANRRSASAGSAAPISYPARGRCHSRDRKSTRLNSSHSQISYAVFCLKKKKKNANPKSARTKSTYSRIYYAVLIMKNNKECRCVLRTRCENRQIDSYYSKRGRVRDSVEWM